MERLLYLYGIILHEEANTSALSKWTGIDGHTNFEVLNYGECAAIVSSVKQDEFGEEALEEKTKKMDWVQEKAYLHHKILMALTDLSTLIPMKFCTIFQSEKSLKKKMEAHEKEWRAILHQLSGKEEWNVKIYNQPERLKEQIADQHPVIQKKKDQIAQLSKGMQYLQRKKLDQQIDDQVIQEQQNYVRHLHREWQAFSVDSAEKKIWNKSVTGKEEDMCWNGAFLIDLENVEGFLGKVTEANEQGEQAGWVIEVTGPWPPYHFSTLSKSEVG
ncbi:GvpL/GvpF family gas vesicle protein [Halobacillus karajensis]|nr:GvpL/GvpF family gas vesicle protein [Halobacillus karajensis]